MAIHPNWGKLGLSEEYTKPYFLRLKEFVTTERLTKSILPPKGQVFAALEMDPFDVHVVIIGQDPYPTKGHAHGLAFSTASGTWPKSLARIRDAIEEGGGLLIDPCLEGWTRQGVLLLNRVLTVEEGKANSHKDKGWEQFTEAVINCLNKTDQPIVFMLWGAAAQEVSSIISRPKTLIIKTEHPIAGAYAGNRKWDYKNCFHECSLFLSAFGISRPHW